MFVRSRFLSAFIVILGNRCEAKFIRGTSLIFSTVIWSYITPFLNWRQKDKWNKLEGSWTPYTIKLLICIKHWFANNVLSTRTTENPQALRRKAFIYFWGREHYDMYYLFSIKQNVKDIFIYGNRIKEQQKESDISKSIEKVKLWQNFWGKLSSPRKLIHSEI